MQAVYCIYMYLNDSFVLAIDRDQSYARSLEFALRDEGYAYRHFIDLGGAQPCLTDPKCSAVVIGRNLEEGSGVQLAKVLRNAQATSKLIIILVAHRYDEYDVIEGLDAGADDYMGKPLASKELVCRFKAILRRRTSLRPDPSLRQKPSPNTLFGELTLDDDDATAKFEGHILKFTRSEFEILKCLAQSPEKVFTRSHLLKLLSTGDGVKHFGENLRKIDVHIRRIRVALANFGNAPVIHSVRGEGYYISKVGAN
jgi:DNA-binding response OmpR family regulator